MQSMTLLAAWQSCIPAAWSCVKSATMGIMTHHWTSSSYLTEPGTCSVMIHDDICSCRCPGTTRRCMKGAAHDPTGCLAKPVGAGGQGPGDRWQLLHDATEHEGCSPVPDGKFGRASHLLMQVDNG